MKELKKSYKELIIMMLVFLGVLLLLPLIPDGDAKLIAIILFNFTNMWMVILMWIICKTERIYWINGVTYEEAKRTDSESRRAYAFRHYKRFIYYSLGYAVYSVISCIINIHFGVDIVIETLGIVAVAISTINIKLPPQQNTFPGKSGE